MDKTFLKPAIVSLTACAGAYAIYYFSTRKSSDSEDSIDMIEAQYRKEMENHEKTVRLFEAGEAEFLKGNIDAGAELIASALSEYGFNISSVKSELQGWQL